MFKNIKLLKKCNKNDGYISKCIIFVSVFNLTKTAKMKLFLYTQIEQLFSLSHQIPAMSSLEGRTEALNVVLPRLLELVSTKELSDAGHCLSLFNTLLQEMVLEEKILYRQDKRILKAQEFIEKNYEKPIRLHDVARYVGLSDGALSRLFRKQINKTFKEYLNEVRIEHSTNLLKKTDDLISEIAYSCGFGSNRHFTKIFRRKKGMTPGAFRKI